MNPLPSFSVARCAALAILLLVHSSCDLLDRLPRLLSAPRAILDSTASAVPRGQRILSIDVSGAEDNNYDSAFRLAQSVGMQAVSLSLDWSDIEATPGVFANEFLTIANIYFPAFNTAVGLDIRPIHTNQKRVPSDLADVAFDDPRMITRFKQLIDYVFSQLPDLQLSYLLIGSEVDGRLDSPLAWEQYTAFYDSVRTYVKQVRPGLAVGVELMYTGLTGPFAQQAQRLNRDSDLVPISYYPLKDGFVVEDPQVVEQAFDKLIALYPGRTLVFHQLGYPSGAQNNSSPEKQRRFIEEAFGAWDRHADQIRQINFTWLTDVPPEGIAAIAEYYGIFDERFAAFIGTLGLRTYSPGAGQSKPAFWELKRQAQARGW